MALAAALLAALTLLQAGSANAWYQKTWDASSAQLTATFGQFGPGHFDAYTVAATSCLNAHISVSSGSAAVFAYVMRQNDFDGWSPTVTYDKITQGIPALPGASCNTPAAGSCDIAASSLDSSQGYVLVLANQNSGSAQASWVRRDHQL